MSIGDGVVFTTMFIAAATGATDRDQRVVPESYRRAPGSGEPRHIGPGGEFADPGVTREPLRIATAEGIGTAAFVIAGGILATLVVALIFRESRHAAAAAHPKRVVHPRD